MAVYFAYEDRELSEIYSHIETAITSDQAGSAFEGDALLFLVRQLKFVR